MASSLSAASLTDFCKNQSASSTEPKQQSYQINEANIYIKHETES